MTQPKNKPIGFHFINTAHPSDATSHSNLSQIRSHAAKDIRARARRSHPAASLPDERSKNRVRPRNQVASAIADKAEDRPDPSHNREQEDAENYAHFRSQSVFPDAVQIPWLSSRDPNWTPARPLSARELFLLDHYINYVVIFNKGSCQRVGGKPSYPKLNGNTHTWFTSMQLKCWLPFALADRGLLQALFLQSCRSLGMLSGSQSYDSMYAAYKHQCIRFTNKSLSFDNTRFSDATIAMVMVLLSESYSLGNLDEWNIHLRACTDMIALRGGVETLGLDGFLKGVIITPVL
ncbi:hypothetical protein G7Z17_g328 [Cylindrodendrum hubeiense]|uniref:Uncharacterized protein n=1 Tax=Cylindrodendrum hubeiense TaxID=595255 RepID=A0A9P5HLV2_9HYPO|nr:hypothetical protein G7Z17_g328 [Cylindrodendrum hubeiense]